MAAVWLFRKIRYPVTSDFFNPANEPQSEATKDDTLLGSRAF
jgi:hypothetical protein